ncbi:adenine deaminase [Alkalicoccus luteus]|uniref:adenine deaminase n=1 Tax=Alkalicoccus luteus TaxID=1237094 RepID=UPI00403459D9
MDQTTRRSIIKTAANEQQADLVLKRASIVNVFSGEIETGDIAIQDGIIAGIGEFTGKEELDVNGRYVVPGLIDGHVHIESSMVSPARFSDVVVPKGVTTVVTDPHEIANVKGAEGIRYMLDDSENVPLDVRFMLPSCVPATPFEHAGAELNAADLRPFYEHPRVIGLAEVMNYPAVEQRDDDMMKKLADAEGRGLNIDGHGAGFAARQVNVYAAAGITTDHECTTADEALERVRNGMYVIIREGSAAKDLRQVLPAVTAKNARRFLFCTDDKHLDELIDDGSIDASIRIAVNEGLDPVTAVQMATLHAAECFQLHTKGAVAPGRDADLLIVDDLHDFCPSHVFCGGKLTAEEGRLSAGSSEQVPPPEALITSVNLKPFQQEELKVKAEKEEALCIEYRPDSIVTGKGFYRLPIKGGYFQQDPAQDMMKLVVLERHHETGHIGVGFIKGLKFTKGAFALTTAHDSHNIVAAGFSDEEIELAVKTVEDMQGGLALVIDGEVEAAMQLDIGGLMSSADAQSAAADLKQVEHSFTKAGFHGSFNPISALSFMCLPVIPSLKLTDMGYFDSELGEHRSV